MFQNSKTLNVRYQKKLAIVVPYRDRSQHLSQFIPHMQTYFERDKLDRNIKYSILIIEQSQGKKFNRGKLKNCGFEIAKANHDYFCFHDIDYLPIWADYSYCECPTRLIWYGLTLSENYETFFGGVVLFNKEDFLNLNGYSNEYWGWGFEDVDLFVRIQRNGLQVDKRDGTFMPLPHVHQGIETNGTLSVEAQETQKLFREHLALLNTGYRFTEDGLSNLGFTCESSQALAENVFIHKVSI
jgi:N-terminal region of glycosyl transferase group 7/N-terminal domain of galactosyltransferase